jgi:hypothetical protein
MLELCTFCISLWKRNGDSDPHLPNQNRILFLTGCGSRSRQMYRYRTPNASKHNIVFAHFPQNVSSVSINIFSLFVITSLPYVLAGVPNGGTFTNRTHMVIFYKKQLTEARRNGTSKGSSLYLYRYIVNNISFFFVINYWVRSSLTFVMNSYVRFLGWLDAGIINIFSHTKRVYAAVLKFSSHARDQLQLRFRAFSAYREEIVQFKF